MKNVAARPVMMSTLSFELARERLRESTSACVPQIVGGRPVEDEEQAEGEDHGAEHAAPLELAGRGRVRSPRRPPAR